MKRGIMKPVSKEVAQSSQGEDKQEPVVFLPTTLKVGRRPPKVTLSEPERSELEALLRKTTAPIAHVRRAKIALLSADDVPNKEIAITLGLSEFTASKWRQRFSRYGISVLDDAPRIRTPKTHDDDKIAEIIRLTTTTESKNATHWSTTSMAKRTGVTQLKRCLASGELLA